MTRRIVFLDMDGVICTPRAAIALGDYGIIRALDPVGIQFLNRLYCAAPFEIVVTSTWRKEVDVGIVLQAAGCVARTAWPHWRTSECAIAESKKARPYEIELWLEQHGPVDSYIILDDDGFDWTQEQRERWIPTDPYNGISLYNMEQAVQLFGVQWPQAKGRSHNYPQPEDAFTRAHLAPELHWPRNYAQ